MRRRPIRRRPDRHSIPYALICGVLLIVLAAAMAITTDAGNPQPTQVEVQP